MFGFIKKYFFYSKHYFWLQYIKCEYIKVCFNEYQECKIRTKITDVNNNEPRFYPYSI